MVEPISITLSALTLLDPAIKSVRKAYGVYKLTSAFGEHYMGVQRRLDGEQARLENALDISLISAPSKEQLTQIKTELGELAKHFQACQDIVASINSRMNVEVSELRSQQAEPIPVVVPRPSKWKLSLLRKSGRKALFSRKQNQSPTVESPSDTATLQADSTNDENSLDRSEALRIAVGDEVVAQHLQSKATMLGKAKWLKQRKDFLKHIEEIRTSNDLIKDIVSLRVLKSIHNFVVGPEFNGKIPADVLTVQDSLGRLHHALKHSNRSQEEQGPAIISIRIMTAAAYVRLRDRLSVQHDYVDFRNDSALYPLQIQPTAAATSTVVLAETLLIAQEVATPRIELDKVIPLSGLLLGQSTDADEAFRRIGSITNSQGSPDICHLFQDVTTTWSVQDTLAGLVESNGIKFRTYIQLALQVTLSYMYLASIGTTHRCPRLADYQYYKATQDTKRNLGAQDVLEPYLSVGFGARAPLKSTRDIGGTSYSSVEDEVMLSLGLILHELGCWKMLEAKDLQSARELARAQRKDLQMSAGTSYTLIVDSCFAAKEVEWEQHARARNVYKKVVVPLEKLVSDLGWT